MLSDMMIAAMSAIINRSGVWPENTLSRIIKRKNSLKLFFKLSRRTYELLTFSNLKF